MSRIVIAIVCSLAAIATVYPMYYVLIMSISDPMEVVKGNIFFWPRGLYLGSYRVIMSDIQMWRSAGYSVFYVASGTLLMLLTSVLLAYPLTCPHLYGRKPVSVYLVITMYFSGGIIPSFLLYNALGIYNTIWAMILPGYSIWFVMLVRTYFATIPRELSEAAFMDGANNYRTLWKIYLPLAKPVLAVVAIYSIVGIWNSWFGALIYLADKSIHPLQLYLQRVLIAQSVDLTKIDQYTDRTVMEELVRKTLTARQLKYAMIIFVSAPIIMVYPMFQKHFIKGVMLGSLKG